MPDPNDRRRLSSVRAPLLAWFARNRRLLPWREDRTAYAVWVSEVMLQQTQVETARPFFERWMERFPDVVALANAPEEDVIASWAGLGYYIRARNLQRSAQIIVAEWQGIIPDSVEELLKLPGIGRYTAGAIASIAYNHRAPVVDGNVMRVLCRVLELPGDPREGETNRRLWESASALAQGPDPGALNEALMELGALVCIPGNPRCSDCPITAHCDAFRHGTERHFPELKPPLKCEAREHTAVILRRGDQVLLQKRSGRRVWDGLRAFPTDFPEQPQTPAPDPGPLQIGSEFSERYTDKPAGILNEPDLEGMSVKLIATIKHGVMNWKITLRALLADSPDGWTPSAEQGEWAPIDALSQLALPSPHRKIARMLSDGAITQHEPSASEAAEHLAEEATGSLDESTAAVSLAGTALRRRSARRS